MKRLWRWAFNSVAGVSAILCVLLVFAAWRSAFVLDEYWRFRYDPSSRVARTDLIVSSSGGVFFEHTHEVATQPKLPGWRHSERPGQNNWRGWFLGGVRVQNDGWSIRVPYWLLTLLAGLVPLLRVAGYMKQRKRAMTGRCIVCGYDLRATPDRCPECGAVPETAKGAAG